MSDRAYTMADWRHDMDKGHVREGAKINCSHDSQDGVVHGATWGEGLTWCGASRSIPCVARVEYMFPVNEGVNCMACLAMEPAETS